MSLSSSTELEPPPRWRMVTSDWTQDSWSTALFPHHQRIKKGHKSCNPHPKCCLLFPGTRDDHPVRSSVWPLSISSLRRANSFKLNCCFIRVNAGFRQKKIPWLRSGRERLLLCEAEVYAQEEEVIEERDLCPSSQKVSWVWCLSGESC